MHSPQLSIIVPVLNEAYMLDRQLDSFYRLSRCAELIFVDGGSDDGSVEMLRENSFTVVRCLKGRARQMNFGAQQSNGKSLLFLHADTQISDSFTTVIEEIVAYEWGFFHLRLSKQRLIFYVLSKAINIRSWLFNVATGDQGIFVRREVFDSLGGFPDIELMEDIALTRKLRKLSAPKILSEILVTSSRRWEERGVYRTICLMWCLQLAYKVGVPPKTLRLWYR